MRNPLMPFCCLLLLAFFVAPNRTLLAGPTTETAVLPVWSEIFARPKDPLVDLPAPADNPFSEAKAKLGKALFFDTRLSSDSVRACASCHDHERGFTDGLKRAAARDGKTELANSPSLLNLAWSKQLFWDGRAKSLEDQAWQPIENRQEMAGEWPTIVGELSTDNDMAKLFRAAFGVDAVISKATVTQALATYVRTLVSPAGRFDRFIDGDVQALSVSERAGFLLFVGKGGCAGCHWGWRFTDDRMHLTGIGDVPIKTPGLRQVSNTAPYMHDGSKTTLKDVITHYTSFTGDRTLSANLVRPLSLNSQEIRDLIAFLKAL